MPRSRRSFEAVIRVASEALRAAHVDHVFVGGLSVVIFGLPRTTADVDVLAVIKPIHVPALRKGFRRRGFLVSEEDLRSALHERSHCTIEDTRSPFRIDLAPVASPADRHAMRARKRVRWRGIPLLVAAPEHTIVMKLKYRSDRDLEDALAVYTRQKGRLNLRRMRAFARQQGVSEDLRALERKMREHEPVD